MLPHKANKKSKGTDNILFTWFSLKGLCCPFSGTNSLNSLFPPLLNITLYFRFNIEQILSGKMAEKDILKKEAWTIPRFLCDWIPVPLMIGAGCKHLNNWPRERLLMSRRFSLRCVSAPKQILSSTEIQICLIFYINYHWVIINPNFLSCIFLLVQLNGTPHKYVF